MEFNAFSAGVAPGGLLDARDIRVLVCYMLLNVDEPMSRQTIVDIVFAEGMANFFETEAAIDELVHLGNMTEDENGLLELTPMGRSAATTLTSRLPYTLREKSVEAALRLQNRQRRARDTQVDIKELDIGYAITCSIDKTENPMMSVTLRVADRHQAEMIKERFLDDPVTLYHMILYFMTDEMQVRKIGNHTILELP